MRLNWSLLVKRTRVPAAVVAMGGLLVGAYWLGGVPPAGASSGTVSEAADETPAPRAPEPVSVPGTAAAARSSGVGGQSWMSGDTARLGADFKRAVTEQFGDGTLGQAHMAMAGLGFQCAHKSGGRMMCEKSIRADNCTLTWSVRLESEGGAVGGAGGEGFSRECS